MAETLEIVIKGTDQASSVIGGVGSVLGKVGGFVGGTVMAGLKVAAAGAAAGIGGLAAGLGVAIGEAMEAQEGIAQLNAVLASTKGVAGITAEEALDLADSLSQVTRFSDDAVLGAENMLLTFTSIGEDVFPSALETVLNMSQALGQDLQGSAVQVGKALQDPILGVTALRRVGVNFNETQQEMIKAMVESGDVMGAQKFILQELQTEFGGSARAAGETFGGQIDILKNKLLNIAEGVGMELLPTLSKLMDTFGPMITEMAQKLADFVSSDAFKKWLEDAVKWLRDELPPALRKTGEFFKTVLLPAIVEAGKWMGTVLVPALRDIWNWMSTNLPPALERIGPLFRDVGNFVSQYVLPAISSLARFIGPILGPLMTAFIKGWEIQIGIFKLALTPIKNVVEAFGFLVEKIGKVKDMLAGLELPDWLTPGSPTPLELGVRGINEAMSELSMGGLGKFNGGLNVMAGAAAVPVGGGGNVTVVVQAGTLLSFADEAELERKLTPIVRRAVGR